MRCVITPGKIAGEVFISPSKSETMRAIIFASMASGVSTISNILLSPDTFAMIEGVRSFGVKVTQEGTSLQIHGVGGKLLLPEKEIDVGNSGLALRFLMALSALVEGEVKITGDESIRTRRPVKPLLDVYRKNGMSVSSFDERGILSISGRLKPGSMVIDGEDSQPVSSLLFSTAFLKEPSQIVVLRPGEKPWVDLTLHWLQFVGASIGREGYKVFEVEGNLSYSGFNITVGGDYSTALFPIAAALVTGGSMKIHGLDKNSAQGDKKALDIFRQMGANIEFDKEGVLVASLPGQLEGVDVNINHCIDVLPILAVAAAFARSKTIIRGAEIARYKESNRIKVMMEQLSKMGVKIKEQSDGLIILPSKPTGATLSGEKDHRVVLALMVAAAGGAGTSVVDGSEVIIKSYPTAIYDFLNCGMNLTLAV